MSRISKYHLVFEDGERLHLKPHFAKTPEDIIKATSEIMGMEQLKDIKKFFRKEIDSFFYIDRYADYIYIPKLTTVNNPEDCFLELEGHKLIYKNIKKIDDQEDLAEAYGLTLKQILNMFIKHKDWVEGMVHPNSCDYCNDEGREYLYIRFEMDKINNEYSFLDKVSKRNEIFEQLNDKYDNFELIFEENLPNITFWLLFCEECGAIEIELEPNYD